MKQLISFLLLIFALGFSNPSFAEDSAARFWDMESLKEATTENYPQKGDDISLIKAYQNQEITTLKEVSPAIGSKPAVRVPETRRLVIPEYYAEGKVTGAAVEPGTNGGGMVMVVQIDQKQVPDGKPDIEVTAAIDKDGFVKVSTRPL